MSLTKTNQKGFTIVELLIVIVVIAILAAISIVAFTGVQQRGRDSQRAADANSIVKALTSYTAQGASDGGGDWPANSAAAVTALNGYTTANIGTSITSKMQVAAPASGSSIQYQYRPLCNGATPTGARITYWKEQGTPSGLTTVTAGTGVVGTGTDGACA